MFDSLTFSANGTEFGDWLHEMKRISSVLVSPLTKPLHHQFKSIAGLETHHDLTDDSEPNLDPSYNLMAPTKNLTAPEEGGPELEEILGFSGSRITNIDAETFRRIMGGSEINPEQEKKTFHLERFNAIGEDYVEGIGNVGSLYNSKEIPGQNLNAGDEHKFRKGGEIIDITGEDLLGARKLGLNNNPVGELENNDVVEFSTPPPLTFRHRHHYNIANIFKSQEKYGHSFHNISGLSGSKLTNGDESGCTASSALLFWVVGTYMAHIDCIITIFIL